MAQKKVSIDENKNDANQQILRRLSSIESKVDSLDQTSAFVLRTDEDKHYGTIKKIFGRGINPIRIYLAVNGLRSVQEISDLLGIKISNVSPILTKLVDEGVIEIKRMYKSNLYYGKTVLDKNLRISKKLKEEYKLTDDGLRIP